MARSGCKGSSERRRRLPASVCTRSCRALRRCPIPAARNIPWRSCTATRRKETRCIERMARCRTRRSQTGARCLRSRTPGSRCRAVRGNRAAHRGRFLRYREHRRSCARSAGRRRTSVRRKCPTFRRRAARSSPRSIPRRPSRGTHTLHQLGRARWSCGTQRPCRSRVGSHRIPDRAWHSLCRIECVVCDIAVMLPSFGTSC